MIHRPYKLLSDERLARLAGDGSDPAFAVLHRRYDALLNGYTRSIARDGEDAADALQNAWIAALIALRADRRSAPVRPWLFRIAHNAAVDVLRRRAAQVRPIDRGVLTFAPGADEQYAHRQNVAEMVGDIGDLPTNQRAALVMRELADLDYGEIAIALSTSEGNARQLVFAARDGLRESRAGRALPCEAVRGVLARADGRELRRRRLRAHLDVCSGCRDYAAGVARPRSSVGRKVAGYAPGPALLQGIFAAAGGSGAAVTSGGSFAGLAKGAVAAVLVVAGVGTGELVVVNHGGGDPDPRDVAAGAGAAVTRSGVLSGRAGSAAVAAAVPRQAAAAPVAAKPRVASAASRAAVTKPAVVRTKRRSAQSSGSGAAATTRTVARTNSTPRDRGDDQAAPGSRNAPGGSEPAATEPEPHPGYGDDGWDAAGPRGWDGGGGRGGAHGARGDRARDCDPDPSVAGAEAE